MPAAETGESFVKLASEVVQQYGSQLRISNVNAQKQFTFCLPLFDPN
jgi:hypothetical protein